MSARPMIAMPHDEFRLPLIRYLMSLGLARDECEDVAQESFLRLHRHVANGGGGENIRGWLFRVAHNEARNRQRTYERRYGSSIEGVDAESGADPENAYLEKEKHRRLDAALKALPARERECLRLRAEGKRYREIGEAMGLPVSTVADLVERAVRTLAEKCHG